MARMYLSMKDIIGECAFGFSINSQQSTSEYAKAILDCSELVTLRVFNPVLKYDALYHRYAVLIHRTEMVLDKIRACMNVNLPSPACTRTANGRRWLEAIKIVHALPETVIKERHEQRLKGIVKPVRVLAHSNPPGNALTPDRLQNPDFLDVLMEAYTGDEKTGLTLQDVRDEVDTFMFEGHDTTGSGLQWILYAVAQRPEVEARIIEEVDQVLGDRLSPDWNDLKSFPYLAMVIKETLRLYPPVPFITRMATNEELTIMGHRVPKGVRFRYTGTHTHTHMARVTLTFSASPRFGQVNVGIAVAAIHRNPEYWENPDVFDPERFSPEVHNRSLLNGYSLCLRLTVILLPLRLSSARRTATRLRTCHSLEVHEIASDNGTSGARTHMHTAQSASSPDASYQPALH